MTIKHGRAIPMGNGAEFDAIRAMVDRWGARARELGDDAALLEVPRGDQLVVSVDASVEGRHFRREWLTPRQIANRAVRAALSDLAAMAAHPLGILVALGVPDSWRPSLIELADGIGDALEYADTVILGGNLSGADELSLTTTVLGHAFAPLRRDAAAPGQAVFVTGRLGSVGAAIAALDRGARPRDEDLGRVIDPRPRLREGRWLAAAGATAAIDISDGLSADLGHLAAASGCSIEIDVGLLPAAAGVDVAGVLASGEEYELVVAAPPTLDVAGFMARFPDVELTCIGRIHPGVPGVRLMDGQQQVSMPRGHDHFSTPVLPPG